jgi:hypothetical protein
MSRNEPRCAQMLPNQEHRWYRISMFILKARIVRRVQVEVGASKPTKQVVEKLHV